MRVIRLLLLPACLSLAGCIFGYYASAPDGYSGDFVLKRPAQIGTCDIGPGLWSGSTDGTCIESGCTRDCVALPAGTPVRVLHTWVDANGIRDVSVRVDGAGQGKVAHAYGNWPQIRDLLARP